MGEGIQISAEYFTCFYLFWGRVSSHVAQTGLQSAMRLTLIFLPSVPLCSDYQSLLPGLVYVVLEIWPRPSYTLNKHSSTKLDPSLIAPINIFVVDAGISLAIYKNTMSSKLFLPNTRSIFWKVPFKSNLILGLWFVYFCWCMWW